MRASHPLSGEPELSRIIDKRNHDLNLRTAATTECAESRPTQGAHLSLVQSCTYRAEAYTTGSKHGVHFTKLHDSVKKFVLFVIQLTRSVADKKFICFRQKLMQRRVEKSNGDRTLPHDIEQFVEVTLLRLLEIVQEALLGFGVVTENERPHDRQSIIGEKHVLGSTKPDTDCPVLERPLSIASGICIGTDRYDSVGDGVSPIEQLPQLRGDLLLIGIDCSSIDRSGATVDRDDVAFGEFDAVYRHRRAVNLDIR